MAEETDHIRVLVIDGSRNVRDFVAEQVLLPNGYRPILARDGVEGLRLALAEIPDAILMDFELPMMSGRDVLESLHSRPLQIPVILMTSRGTEQVAVRLIRMGVRDYLLKPFTADELLQSLERVLFEVQLRRESTELAKQLTFANRRLKQCLLEFNVVSQMGRAIFWSGLWMQLCISPSPRNAS
jgi:DNA-binding response OmpR family regulator